MTGNAISNIERVITGGYCIGCGACAVKDRRILMTERLEMPQAQALSDASADEVCPFSSTVSEDVIAESLYSGNDKYDKRVGYYTGIFVGFAAELDYRQNASSGGMISWILAQLMEQGEIDGVIHVGESIGGGYEYRVSESLTEVLRNSKSRYYPVHFDEALQSVLGNGKRYAFVGVPCFVKAVRLLGLGSEMVSESIKFTIAIFCGHLKTKAFSEMIAMQQGISSEALKAVDFRVKTQNAPANRYSTQVHYKETTGGDASRSPIPVRELYGLDWGLGYFKPLACDWCDDIAGEVADVSCGDAWLPEVVHDGLGNNILVVRNRLIQNILDRGIVSGSIKLDPAAVDAVYESQAGNYRHRQEGLSVRIADAMDSAAWVPTKRITPNSFDVSTDRKSLYRLRSKISARSHEAFSEAKKKNSFLLFMLMMAPLELRYAIVNRNVVRGLAKMIFLYFQFFRRKFL